MEHMEYIAKLKDGTILRIEERPQKTPPTFGEKLRIYRKNKNLTQAMLAEKSGLSVLSIRRYETNERDPKLKDIKRLAEALGISPILFVTDNRPMLYWSDILKMIFDVDSGKYPLNPNQYDDPKLNTITASINEEKKKLSDGSITKEEYEKWEADMLNVFHIPIE